MLANLHVDTEDLARVLERKDRTTVLQLVSFLQMLSQVAKEKVDRKVVVAKVERIHAIRMVN